MINGEMSDEEAIVILINSKKDTDYPHGAYGIAIDKAVKALKQPPKYLINEKGEIKPLKSYEEGYKDGMKARLKLVNLKINGEGDEMYAYLDESRQLLFSNYITTHMAKELGMTWEEAND